MARGSYTTSINDLGRNNTSSGTTVNIRDLTSNAVVENTANSTTNGYVLRPEDQNDGGGYRNPLSGFIDPEASQGRALANPIPSGSGSVTANLSGIRPNALNRYSSFNNLFTISCLTREQQNSGEITYENISNVITSSKGDWNNGGRRATTTFGNFDFFVDDLVIVTIPSINERTGNSIPTKISFKVTEPYSIGLFLLTLQQGAVQSGYQNYREAAYLLTIEWAGYDDNNVPSIDPSLTRFIPFKFREVEMKVTSSGATYECEGFPYNELAFRDQVTQIKTNVRLSGSSVEELLREVQDIDERLAGEIQTDGLGYTPSSGGIRKSLTKALKDFQQNLVRQRIISAPTDEYVITFPRDFTDPGDSGNDIGKAVLFKDLSDNGTVPFPENNSVFDPVRRIYQNRRINVSEKKNFEFPRGTKIEDIITEVVIRSDYIADQLLNGQALTNPTGMIKWFRIEARVEDKEEYNSSLGRQARKYIYRVIPYEIHVHRFLTANTPPAGYQNLTRNVHKLYDYFYTGRNTEVLNVNLDFKMSFFAPVPSDATRNTGTEAQNFTAIGVRTSTESIAEGEPTTTQLRTGPGVTYEPTYMPGSQIRPASDSARTQQIRHLQNILESPGDLINLEIEIMGDPYYISSSGMGNQSRAPVSNNMLSDGSMNYQNGEVDILLRFRTPIDLDPDTGNYKFAQTIDQFSGLFQVREIESKFSKNKFTQTLKCIRRRVQLGESSPDGSVPQELVFRTGQ